MTEARMFKQFAQGCYLKAQGRGSNPRPSSRHAVKRPKTITPPCRPHCIGGIFRAQNAAAAAAEKLLPSVYNGHERVIAEIVVII